MKKVLLTACLFLGLGMFVQAQTYPLVSIFDIQNVPGANLSSCNDSSSYNGDTVRVRGIVQTHPDSARYTQAFTGAQFWLQDDTMGFHGIDIISFADPQTTGIGNLIVGDSIEITGVVEEYQDHETELVPLATSNVLVLGTKSSFPAKKVQVSDLGNTGQVNQLPTGEQWEGMYVEIQNISVKTVDPFSGGTRVSFTVQDASGNTVNISDKFMAQQQSNSSTPGNFSAPNVGDQFCFIRGIVAHSPNGCTGSNGRGYEINPVKASDYCINSAAPTITNVSRNSVTPACTTATTISADIIDADGISSAKLYYAIGGCSTNWTSVNMTVSSGNTYTAQIPGQADGTFVKYYIEATDNNSNTSEIPNVSGGSDPEFYTTRCNGTTIYDVQYVPNCFTSGASGYEGMTVTVEGVVSASAESNNLGFVFIQEESQLDWAGIMLLGSTTLSTLVVGDKVTVTGEVEEDFGYTRINNISSISKNGTGTISPLALDAETFTTYDVTVNEAYEGMLIELKSKTSGQPLYVVEQNADGTSNFAEWRVGSDQFNPSDGCRVLTGRQTSSAFGSLNVSWVNDTMWATTSGVMNVPACVVSTGMTFDKIRGIMYYSFSNFKILPRNNSDFDGATLCYNSIEGDLENGNVSSYPNPVSDKLTVAYDLKGSYGQVNVAIYDLMGSRRAVKSISGTNGTASVDVNQLPSGTYIMAMTGEHGEMLYRTKIVVLH